MTGCVFCQIIEGRVASHQVLDEPEVVAFLDRRPLFKGHVLVVPREHFVTLPDAPPETLVSLMEAVRRIAATLPSALGAEGTFVAVNNVVSQSVPHLHVHVVPRTKGDGLRGFFWPRTTYAEGEVSEYGSRLRSALADQA